jgi:photosystem II stability/assembly factor-like uncharacterized protein
LRELFWNPRIVVLGVPRPTPAYLLTALSTAILLAACGSSGSTQGAGTIVVPLPVTPQPEPSGIAQRQPNLKHIHAIATRDGGHHLLLGTHTGMATAAAGGLPQPIATGPKGDILQVVYGGGSTFFAGGHGIGVWVTNDDGVNWTTASADVTGFDVHGLAVDPRNNTDVYVYAVGKGLLMSSDAGAHWSHRAGFADGNYLTGLTVTGDGTLLAGSPELGILASTDHGTNFVPVRNATGQVYSLASAATNGDVVIAAAQTGLFLTPDGGKSWSVGDPSVAVTGVAVDPANSSHLYAGTADGRLSKSADGGTTWVNY